MIAATDDGCAILDPFYTSLYRKPWNSFQQWEICFAPKECATRYVCVIWIYKQWGKTCQVKQGFFSLTVTTRPKAPGVARFPKPLPYFWPKRSIFPTLFMNWPKIWYPIYSPWAGALARAIWYPKQGQIITLLPLVLMPDNHANE